MREHGKLDARWLVELGNMAMAFNMAKAAGLDPFRAEWAYEKKHADPLCDASREIEQKLLKLPAQDIQEVAAKYRTFFHADCGLGIDQAKSVMADLEGLALGRMR
ncbi:MAG: hypothetical protein COB16_06580 [Rhodobacteraceae bacterium]|nr:MAG: hypothetical protein COB16_06580 [Paracoccaceae bacterium]